MFEEFNFSEPNRVLFDEELFLIQKIVSASDKGKMETNELIGADGDITTLKSGLATLIQNFDVSFNEVRFERTIFKDTHPELFTEAQRKSQESPYLQKILNGNFQITDFIGRRTEKFESLFNAINRFISFNIFISGGELEAFLERYYEKCSNDSLTRPGLNEENSMLFAQKKKLVLKKIKKQYELEEPTLTLRRGRDLKEATNSRPVDYREEADDLGWAQVRHFVSDFLSTLLVLDYQREIQICNISSKAWQGDRAKLGDSLVRFKHKPEYHVKIRLVYSSSEKEEQARGSVEYCGIRLDLDTGEVEYNGLSKDIKLKKGFLQFSFLKLLLEAGGGAVSNEDIEEELGKKSLNMKSLANELRKKLGLVESNEKDIKITKEGGGYKIKQCTQNG